MYQSIQACRAAASLLVMLFHLGGTVALDRYFGVKAFDGPFSFGDVGVSFFFVLSGFVIAMAHRNDIGQPHKFRRYFWKRVIRIYPTYLLIAGAVFVGAWSTPSLRASMPQDAGSILMEALLLPQPAVNGGTGATILIVAWSLQYEVFFYALTSLLIIAPVAWLVAVIALAIAWLTVHVGGLPVSFPLSFFTSESVPLFGFGMLLAWLAKSRLSIPRPDLLALLGFVVFAGMGAFEVTGGIKLPNREMLYGLASCLIILGLVRAEDNAVKPWSLPKLSLLGDASYALYLVHFPLISVICKAVRATGLTCLTGATVAVVLSIVASLVVSVAFYLWIEKPLMTWLSRRRAVTVPKTA